MSHPDWARRRTDAAVVPGRVEPPPSRGHDGRERPVQRLLELGRRCERSGRLDEAIDAYEATTRAAEASPDDRLILAEALRRLAVMLNRRGEAETARSMCERSYAVAVLAEDLALRAEALNTLGGLELVRTNLDEAGEYLERALELSDALPELRGRIEQNLGILSNIRGDRPTALVHYHASLQSFLAAGNDHGCAVAYHNLGMISAHQGDWPAADQYFEQGRRTAQTVGDDHLRGLCLMNRVQVLIALRRFEAAQLAAETALSIFEELHAPAGIADVQRMLGVVFRETGRLAQAQSRLELAVELSGATGSPVSQGEALRESARLHCQLGNMDQAIEYLSRACRQFNLVPVTLHGPEVARGEYPNFVRDWCDLVRAVDPATADHSDWVAAAAAGMSRAVGLPVRDQATIRVAGQLHEVGVLQQARPGDWTPGADLLSAAQCFPHVVPLVRPADPGGDGCGVERPRDSVDLGRQVLRLADAYDTLVRGHRGEAPLSRAEALARLSAGPTGWAAEVWEALVSVTGPRAAAD